MTRHLTYFRQGVPGDLSVWKGPSRNVHQHQRGCRIWQWGLWLSPVGIPVPSTKADPADSFTQPHTRGWGQIPREWRGTRYCRNESFIFTAFRSFLPYVFYLLVGTTSIPLSEPPEETTTLQPEYGDSRHSEYGSIEYGGGSGDYETYPQYDDYESDDVTPTPTLASDYHYPDYRERDGDYEGGARCGH